MCRGGAAWILCQIPLVQWAWQKIISCTSTWAPALCYASISLWGVWRSIERRIRNRPKLNIDDLFELKNDAIFFIFAYFCWSRIWWNPSNCLECSVHQGTATPLACLQIGTCFSHFIWMVQLVWPIDRFLFIQKWLKRSWQAEAHSSFHYIIIC